MLNIVMLAGFTEPAPGIEIGVGALLVLIGIGVGIYRKKKGGQKDEK